MILSELISLLKRLEVRPKKGLSQNFLIDPNVIQKIIQLGNISPGESVLEIGPGPGSLTKKLLETGAKITAVEIDPIFAQNLHHLQNGKLSIFEQDFLKFPMDILPKKIKVVANLPYHITAPILEKLFASSFSSITMVVQKEVASRIMAKVGTKEFGSLSLFVRFHAKIEDAFPVPANCFYPKPKVDSTVIRIESRPLPNIDPFHLIHPAFQHRRKMISSCLNYPKEQIQQALLKVNARADARAEMLTLDQWIRLALELPSRLA